MDRLISEQAVIESIEFFQMNPQHFDFVNLIDDIKEIPPGLPKWIPCSERLPEIHNYMQEYIVTIKGNFIRIAFFTETNGKSWWSIDNVIAWCELPEPYKAEGGKA